MKKNKRAFRWTCVGILCAGLLLVGVGAGMGLAEAATFTYAGDRVLPETAETRDRSFRFSLEPEETAEVSSHAGNLRGRLREIGRMETSEEVAPGTLRLDVTYQTVGPEIDVWVDEWEDDRRIFNLYWDDRNELAAILACKDQILADLKDRQIGDYTPAELTGAVITVNPADAERVSIE